MKAPLSVWTHWITSGSLAHAGSQNISPGVFSSVIYSVYRINYPRPLTLVLYFYKFRKKKVPVAFLVLLIFLWFQRPAPRGSDVVAFSLRSVTSSLLPTAWRGETSEDFHCELGSCIFFAMIADWPYLLTEDLTVATCLTL